ncbi:two-component system response regulator [Aquimarina aggregata]|uniref:Two-component system response regulator n=1 Tax=Aquimarina aggregata TaxID=1642818 RepID=A0A163C209_9FLAO|nr:LytTR family DNA-binding domain-containing protein [Aquimarina aggregata]KZS41990.1 two-component system response regulator [Aquimarina aggregata]
MKKPQIKCAVVDDSPTQRLAITNQIKKYCQLELVGVWNNAIEAKNALLDVKADVLFLDIEMPVLNGFKFLDDLENKPHVVIVTGKSKYAHKAFDYHAIDFLKKPLRSNRFGTAIEKVLQVYNSKSNIEPNTYFPSIFIKSGTKQHKVYLNDILYISAMGDFAKVHLEGNNSLVITGTMTYLESLLPNKKFFRAHRSFIVNLEKIENFTTRYMEIKNETIPISRQKKQELKDILNFM